MVKPSYRTDSPCIYQKGETTIYRTDAKKPGFYQKSWIWNEISKQKPGF
jgi:hypothetical protein